MALLLLVVCNKAIEPCCYLPILNNQSKLIGLVCIIAFIAMTICPPESVQNS